MGHAIHVLEKRVGLFIYDNPQLPWLGPI
eukprot:COSAG01_NODE_64621_length_276_cov_0.474576_1_plen_28_part_10